MRSFPGSLKRMWIATAGLALMVACAPGQAGSGPTERQVDEKLDHYLRGEMAKEHIPGLSVAVVQRGRILLTKGYGLANVELNVPATEETAFQMASATKPISGTALMLLVEEGKIGLDEKIGKYLPGIPAAWSDITVRHLATHTSGVKDFVGLPSIPESREELIERVAQLPRAFAPGEKAAYNQTEYVLLAMLIEKVTGKAYPDFMSDRLFRPVRMTATRYTNAVNRDWARRVSDPVRNRASVYSWEDNRQRLYDYYYPTWSYAAGGLYSSAADLARWAAALDTGKLLKQASLEQMWTPARLNDGTTAPFAVGWIAEDFQGHRVVGHSGGPALGDILRFRDEGLTVIVLTNQHSMIPHLAREVATFYLTPSRRRNPNSR